MESTTITPKETIMKHRLRHLLPSVLIPVASIGLTAWILRHLGFLVGLILQADEGDKFDFATIFSQTRDAGLALHIWIPLLCGVLFYGSVMGMAAVVRHRSLCRALCILAWVLLFLVALGACLTLTRVNDIRFCHLLGKLIPLMDKL